VGTLSSELAPHAERLTPRPRIYADANVPAGVVAFMRQRLHWDVLYVIEHDDLMGLEEALARMPPLALGPGLGVIVAGSIATAIRRTRLIAAELEAR
jgi:hypothetical protein